MYEITAPTLKFLRYEHENTEVAREQVQQIDEVCSFEIQNLAEETLEANIIISVNTESETQARI